jgi:hypothetical protein
VAQTYDPQFQTPVLPKNNGSSNSAMDKANTDGKEKFYYLCFTGEQFS